MKNNKHQVADGNKRAINNLTCAGKFKFSLYSREIFCKKPKKAQCAAAQK